MKRRLYNIEIQTIKDRLNRLQIAYVEIYDELLDHYISSLEQFPASEFDKKREALDDEFGWSVVRSLEKELLNAVSKELKNSQLEALKIWKLDVLKVMGIFSYASFLLIIYHLISLDVMMIFSFLPALGILVALLYHSGNYFSLSLDPNYHRPRNVILQAALGKYVLIFNFFNAFFVFTSIFLNNIGLESWAMVLMIFYTTFMNIYALSLYGSINLKNFKLIGS
ncbi:hypothetical protein MMU07_07210 [Aquiflexum sp. LQ15W]|uniref:hypothetical protein n=1 Tax=Cognataquiflexum nitidum TaxID=2922272 RepID=UPI001F13C317|nr:hypothetical protein [Cognataquiflexum nitidum]MCH6199359.1 hypothetical protein [Cognataquiflexum nitidum]